MSLKKLTRIAVVAFTMAVVLAVSSFAAYSLSIENTLIGLEDGVSYTAAKYDFANNAYGEFTEVTSETVLTSGVWGIKADAGNPEALFVMGKDSGKFNFWNAEKNAINTSAFKLSTLTDSYIPGYWSGAKGGAFSNVTTYAPYPSICIHLEKNGFLNKAEIAKTVEIEGETYPVYSIDGTEYYLKEDAYYTVEDNTLYEGEAEATPVTVLTWTGATPIIGDNNLLAESTYMYGFTNEQVVPVTAFEGYTSQKIYITVGSVTYNEGYSNNDYSPKVVFYTKTIGSDVVNERIAVTTYDLGTEILTAVLPDGVPVDEYIVAMSFSPYDGVNDDMFLNNGANNEDRGYFHHRFNASTDNGLTLKTRSFDAPTGLTGGLLTVNGLEDDKNYQWAPVTLNATGDGYAIGEWSTLTKETEVAGLVVVRFCNAEESVFSDITNIMYVNGKASDRQTLGNFKDNGYVICKSADDSWIPGVFAGKSAGQVGEGGALINYASLDQGISTTTDCQTLWLYDHTEETAEAKVTAQVGNTYPTWTGGSKPETFGKVIDDFYASKKELTADDYAAERLAQAQKIADDAEARNNKYAFDNTEIIPVDEVNSFAFFTQKRQGCLTFSGRSKVIFKVMDIDGNVTEYSWTGATKSYGNGGNSYNRYDVDLAELLSDAEGYLVGFAIYPFAEVDVDTLKVADGGYLAADKVSARFIQNHAHQGWYADAYDIVMPLYPKLDNLKGGFGRISGLDDNKTYQYAYLLLNNMGDALEAGQWEEYTESTQLSGLVTVREVTRDGGYSIASDPVYVYGAKDARKDLGERASNGTYLFTALGDTAAVPRFNVGKWTGRQAATNISAFGGANGLGSYGSGWINANFSKDVKAAEAELAALGEDATEEEKSAAQAKIDAARQKVVNRAINNYFTYTYTSDEIIPVGEVVSFGFNTYKRMGSATYSGNIYSTVDAYIALPDGTISVHRFTTAEQALNTKRYVDFPDKSSWTPTLPEEGWVVALSVDQWAGMTDPNKFNFDSNGYNTMPNFIIDPNDYTITDAKLVLEPLEVDMSGLYMEGDVVKGFDKNIKYGICKVTTTGVSENVTLLPTGATSFTVDTGLWAFRAIGNGITESNSLPSKVFYKAGNSGGTILHTTEMTCNGPNNSGKVVDVIDQVNVSGWNMLNRKSLQFNEAKWTGINLDHGCYTYWDQGGPLNLAGTSLTVSYTSVKTAEDALKTAQESGDTAAIEEAQANLDTAIAEKIAEINDVWFTYQYTADEIIPMESFVSHTFRSWARQSGLATSTGSLQTAYTLLVITEDGILEQRTAYKNAAFGNQKGSVITVSLSDFEKTDGYIVGIIIRPYGSATEGTKIKYTGSITADICVMHYADGYKAIAPAPAPEFEVVAASDGVDAVVENAISGATYAWSLDNITWTDGAAGVSVINVPGAKLGDTVYIKMLPYQHYLESYVGSANVPAFKDTPALTLGDGNVLTDTTGAYEIAKYTFNTALTYETLTEKTLTTGVWAVRTKGDDTASASAPQVFYIAGEDVGTVNYVAVKNATDFIEGTWASAYFNTMYNNNVTDYANAGNVEMHFNGTPMTFEKRRAFNLRYLLTEDEIIPANELINLNIGTTGAFYHGYIRDGYTEADGNGSRAVATYGQTLARVHVVGTNVPYYDIITDIRYSQGYSYNIGDFLADKDGYVVAIELYPLWSIFGADGKTELGDNVISAVWNHNTNNGYYVDYTLKMKFPGQFIENELPEGESLPATHSWTTKYTDGTNRYAIKLERLDSAAPTLSINLKNVITITDFSNNKEYAYSTDGGNTWTAVTSATFTATEVNKEYLVKVARNNAYNESEATAITSNPFAVIGTSLVLDGQIGVKAYFNIDTDVVDVNMVTIYNTKKDSDYVDDGTGTGGFREYGAAIKTTSAAKWSTRLLYDEALDLYYVIFFVPAKDADNVHFENELHYYLKPTEDGADPIQVKFGNIGTNFNASAYIEEAKALVEAGDEKFVAAADLINATENYVAYADAYLNGKTIDAYASTETITAEAATRTDTTLDGVEFYGTSLILEDNVTIRHYFKVNDMDAFIAAGYICDVEYGVKDDYIYYDITDIPAQELGTQYALNIKASTGSIIYTVNYSATNYMAEMAKNSDSTLVSLVNAMYDYYLAAEDYAK